jgi:multiple sugar transport system ATP-binding protein
MAQVRLDHVRKEFNGVVAVDDLSLTIEDTEFLTLVGPSGCGKTTTLRMVCGLERPSAGQIYFDDRPVGYLPANKRDVAMVFQSYALYPHMTVAENIGFALRMMRVPKAEIQHRVGETARTLGIEPLLGRKPRELSGGQRQRVAVGRAIVREAGAYLLDEPLSNLDARLRVLMRAELKKLHADLERTFIYVTHDQVEAMTMSDRIAIMNEGVLQQCASPMEVYERPANMFVAGFMGSPPMNFLGGRLERESGELWFAGDQVRQALDRRRAGALDEAGERDVVLGVRPEDVLLSAGPEAGSRPARVFVEEPLGADVLVTVELGGELLKARVAAPFRSAVDGAVQVTFAEPKLHLFAAADGRALSSPVAG